MLNQKLFASLILLICTGLIWFQFSRSTTSMVHSSCSDLAAKAVLSYNSVKDHKTPYIEKISIFDALAFTPSSLIGSICSVPVIFSDGKQDNLYYQEYAYQESRGDWMMAYEIFFPRRETTILIKTTVGKSNLNDFVGSNSWLVKN